MSERTYRLILGFSLLSLLYFQQTLLLYIYIGLLFFEGITNWRIPKLVTMLRFGKEASNIPNTDYKINFEAERALRLVVGILLVLTLIVIPNEAWFFPWFIGIMLTLAGITNMCPMTMTFKWIGLK